MSLSLGMLVVALNTLSAAALLWLLCMRCAKLPVLCRLGFWAGASGLLLHALALLAENRPIVDTVPGRLLPASGYWLLALGWWLAPAGQTISASTDNANARMDAGGRAESGTKADPCEDLDFTDYTKRRVDSG